MTSVWAESGVSVGLVVGVLVEMGITVLVGVGVAVSLAGAAAISSGEAAGLVLQAANNRLNSRIKSDFPNRVCDFLVMVISIGLRLDFLVSITLTTVTSNAWI